MAVLIVVITAIIYNVLNTAGISARSNRNIFILLSISIACCFLVLFAFYQMILRNEEMRKKTEAGLVDAKNIAETANKAKTNFLATMSHEIRTPMHGIIGNISLLNETNLDTEQKKLIKNIHRSSLLLLAVVNDIIDFSYIETGKIPLENTPFVLRDCLNEIFTADGAPLNESKIEYFIDDKLPALIECDPVRLRQILMSIIGDSIKVNDQQVIKLRVSLLNEDEDHLNIEFNISKTANPVLNNPGPGSFGAGEEADTNGSLFGISSLRFSIAGRLVSLMGGNIKMINEMENGNRVIFSIKAKKIDHKSSEKYFNQRRPIEWLDNEMAGKIPLKILTVDDHEMNQVLLVQILTKMGYTCKTARNGAEAVGLAIEEKFDIIFMDILMPVMDGVDATKRIREYYVNTDTPLIIGVTANALLQEKQRGFEAGMNDFLIKPYKAIDVQNMLEKWTALVFKLKYEL